MIKDPIEPFSKADSPHQTISDRLDRLDIPASKIGLINAQQAFELLRGLDGVYLRMQALEPGSQSRKTAQVQFEDILAKLRKEAGRFIRDLGGSRALQQERAKANPPQEHEWWYLDQWLARKRKAALMRALMIGGVSLLLFAVLVVLYNRFLAPDPRDVARYGFEQAATQRMQAGDFESALTEIDQGLQIAPQDPDLLVLKGIVQEQLGQSTQAAASFDAAKKGYANPEDFFQERGQIYLMVNQPAKALADAQSAVDANPQSASAYLLRGQVYETQQKYDAAMDDYNQAYESADMARQTELAAVARMRIAWLSQSRNSQIAPEPVVPPEPVATP